MRNAGWYNGYNAFFQHVKKTHNPYRFDHPFYQSWIDGWTQAEGEFMEVGMDIGMY